MKRIKFIVPALVLLFSIPLLHFPSAAASLTKWASTWSYSVNTTAEYSYGGSGQYEFTLTECMNRGYYTALGSSYENFVASSFGFSSVGVEGVPAETLLHCDLYIQFVRTYNYQLSDFDLIFSYPSNVANFESKLLSLDELSQLPSEVNFSASPYPPGSFVGPGSSDPYTSVWFYVLSFDYPAVLGYSIDVSMLPVQLGHFGWCVGGISYSFEADSTLAAIEDISAKIDGYFGSKITNDNGQDFGDLSNQKYQEVIAKEEALKDFENQLENYLKTAETNVVFDYVMNSVFAYRPGFNFWKQTFDTLFDGFAPLKFLLFSSFTVTIFSLVFKIGMRVSSGWGARNRSDNASIRRSEKARVQREDRAERIANHEDRSSMFDHYGY